MNQFRSDAAQTPLAIGRTIRPRHDDRANDPQPLHLIADLHARLMALLSRGRNLHQTIADVLKLHAERPAVRGTLLVRRTQDGDLSVGSHTLDAAKHDVNKLQAWLLPKAAESLTKGKPVIASSVEDGLECIALATRSLDFSAVVTVVDWPIGNAQRAIELSVAQTVLSFLEYAAQRQQLEESSSQTRMAAATLELVQRIQDATTLDQACLVTTAQLQKHLACDQVFVGLVGRRTWRETGKTCRVRAASKLPTIDPYSEITLNMKAVLDEAMGRGTIGSWPPLPGTRTHQLLAHKQFAGRDSLVITVPLKNREGQIIGALGATGRRELATVPEFKRFLSVIEQPVGEALNVVARHQGNAASRLVRGAFAKQHRIKQIVAFVVTLAAGTVLACPWPYTIRCQSVTEPVERRFCVAPHDGLLETTSAEPGDVVRAGQCLADLDGSEILWELAGVTAEHLRAEAKRDAHQARYETPQAVMADLQARALANKKELLRFRESNLQIRSPIDGIVLSGSLDRRENYPVTKGQVLYEVAPLERLRVEVAVPAEEITHVDVGDRVTLFLEGMGSDCEEGTIDKIRPRAEVRDQRNVFVAEVILDNPDQTLRPGMQGTARVRTDSKRIAWILFHHAAENARAAWFF
ncbi:hypothetical protein Enr13x_77450 [Stieleria neptunia]|uniref:CusB-like beta-barrel domain-containing protein n=1 Tax=Stieleria neptunia TaxID=2527979 RepID=A0A518I3Z9_9BACT|nr:HlyD family efflux transporter periplasmic adaptor subunit [Stieleria neptunia]QDV47833.1 hypothetical protein Enr13x_77450 [Stieleria neptunia]